MFNGSWSEESVSFLPRELLDSACRVGNDYAWRKKDLLEVASAAESSGLASAGWKVMFRTADGDLELCWNNFYPEEKGEDESWQAYIVRTWEQTRQSWRKLFEDDNLIHEGRKVFRLLRETEAPGMLPSDLLWFILYFRRTTEKDPYAR